jgi:hypothetical protein
MREIGEPSNRTKRARHEHSFPRQEITARAQKTMRTGLGFRLFVRVEPLSRQLCVLSFQKPMQEESRNLNTNTKTVDTCLQPGIVEEHAHRRGIDN